MLSLEQFRDTIAAQAVEMPGNQRMEEIQTRALARLAGIETNMDALLRVLSNNGGAPPLAGILGG
jgi:hypothetical protein